MDPQPYFSGFSPLSSDIEPRLMPEARPQWENLDSGQAAVVICVHGFTGTPYEVAPAVQALANVGLPVVALLLPGHGYRARVARCEWLRGCVSNCQMLSASACTIKKLCSDNMCLTFCQ